MRRLTPLLLVLLAAVSCGSPSDVVNSPTAPSVVATAPQQPGDAWVSSAYKKPGTVESPVYVTITNLRTAPMQGAVLSFDYAPYDYDPPDCQIGTAGSTAFVAWDFSAANPLMPGETSVSARMKCLAGRTYSLIDVSCGWTDYHGVSVGGNSLVKPVVDGSTFILDDSQAVPVARVTFYVQRPR